MAVAEPKGWLGRSVKRKEDERFLRGRGNYVEDIKLPGMLHMAILRSPFAHARINSIDTSRAEALDGVVAEDPHVAHDALELIDVDYEQLPVVTSPQQALQADAPVIRDDKEGQTDNRVYHWEAGDKDATERAFAEADRVIRLKTHYQRCHPAPLECCGCVADVNPATGKATIYMTSQAPHAHRTVFALVAGLPEQNIQII